MGFFSGLFGSNGIREQNELRAELMKELRGIIYKLENKEYNVNELDQGTIADLKKKLEKSMSDLDNSCPSRRTDIKNGVINCKDAIEELGYSLLGSITIDVVDLGDELLKDIKQIIDHENGDLPAIKNQTEGQDRDTRKLRLKQNQLRAFQSQLQDKLNEILKQKARNLAVVREIEDKLLAGKGDLARQEQLIFTMDNYKKNAEVNDSGINLLVAAFAEIDALMNYSTQISQFASFSPKDLFKANRILDMEKIRQVISNPKALNTLLAQMKTDLGDVNNKIQLIKGALDFNTETHLLTEEQRKKLEQKQKERDAETAAREANVAQTIAAIAAKRLEEEAAKIKTSELTDAIEQEVKKGNK